MPSIAPYGKYLGWDLSGEILAEGLLYTYEAGTSTPKVTYTDASGDFENTNPVELDGSGLADVWLGEGGYKFILKDKNDNTIWTTDNINGTSTEAFGGVVNLLTTNTSITTAYANSANIGTGTITLSLLTASVAGEGFYFTIKNNGSGTITIDPDGGETIDGAATKSVLPGQSALVIRS